MHEQNRPHINCYTNTMILHKCHGYLMSINLIFRIESDVSGISMESENLTIAK